MTDPAQAWRRACLALAVLAAHPGAVGGLWLRARAGPVRDAFLDRLSGTAPVFRKIHPTAGEDALFGGIDLAATLAAGHVVRTEGLVTSRTGLLLTMAERCPARLAAHLGAARDAGGSAVLALDEGEAEEVPPRTLTERLGLFVSLDGIPSSAIGADGPGAEDVARARDRLPGLECTADQLEALTVSAARLGIDSLRAPLLAAAAARVVAALFGRDRVTSDDVSTAAELVYAHRATVAPDDEAAEAAPPPVSETRQDDRPSGESDPAETAPHADLLVEAARAALPPNLLDALARGRAVRTACGTSGAAAPHRGNRRGRPLPARPGRVDGHARIDVVATLRAAAPWQPIRRHAHPDHDGLHIRKADIRLRRFEEPSDRLLIFAVDASGSAAMARLAETKGAIELLLGEAYARRDHVALVAFRGRAAETLLPPTRSLVQTKRRLQALPGGGGTPLASGLMAALDTAQSARGRGMTPTIALLTDGRGNIALDGAAGRDAACRDAERAARLIRANGLPALVIDTAVRPQGALATLSGTLGATYLAMPRADARRLSDAVRDASVP